MDEQLINKPQSELGLGELVGQSRPMQKVYELIQAIGPADTVVLLLGETGTGKELVARAIHQYSHRRHRSFLKIDCTALPEALLESELFGYRKGAFTDARTDKPGKFEMADGGTVFLDEIGEIPVSIQAKLLRILEEHAFEPLGSVETVRVDVRIVAATNRDLERAVNEGRFRPDLYYRLKVFPIVMPPLRERSEDIPLLIEFFLVQRNQYEKKTVTISQDAVALLTDYAWPGNVRELRHAIEYAFVMSKGERIEIDHLPEAVREEHRGSADGPSGHLSPIEEMEKRLIVDTLRKHGGSREKAAGTLNISRITLWRRMRKYSIK
jgi:transcriptional regulator with PAS, ATPase and Fis domain